MTAMTRYRQKTYASLKSLLWTGIVVDVGNDKTPDYGKYRQNNCVQSCLLSHEILASLVFFFVRLFHFALELTHFQQNGMSNAIVITAE